MKTSNLINDLRQRGHLQDISDEAGLIELLESEKISFYCGFDPTADSLHVGSLLPLIVMKKFIEHGHTAIALVGTATGMIGDPSGKTEERALVDPKVTNQNAEKIQNQIHNFLGKSKNFKLVKNGDWLASIKFIDMLREVGKHFSVNQMIARDSVKTRLTEREQGISYTEFSYMILQALDFRHLYKHENCKLQIGGSDQWGNIASGIDLIRRMENSQKSYGLTIPLLINSNGKKFGKTESGNVWLSEEKTSSYAFYQFWLNTTDDDVEKYLKLFSSLSIAKIEEIIRLHKEKPESRTAQIALAFDVCSQLHGEEKAIQAKRTSEVLFQNKLDGLTYNDLILLKNEIPTFEVSRPDVSSLSVTDLLFNMNACESKSAARKLIQNGGISLNGEKVSDVNQKIELDKFLDRKACLVKIGKKHYHLVIVNE